MAILRWGPGNGGIKCSLNMKKIAIFDQYLASPLLLVMRASSVVNRVLLD